MDECCVITQSSCIRLLLHVVFQGTRGLTCGKFKPVWWLVLQQAPWIRVLGRGGSPVGRHCVIRSDNPQQKRDEVDRCGVHQACMSSFQAAGHRPGRHQALVLLTVGKSPPIQATGRPPTLNPSPPSRENHHLQAAWAAVCLNLGRSSRGATSPAPPNRSVGRQDQDTKVRTSDSTRALGPLQHP